MGQQWTRALSDLGALQPTGIRSAAAVASATVKPRVQILEKDVLTLCEGGDLLLMREQVANAGLRVTMDPVVARDISRMQHGQFPAQRVTSLPVTVDGILLTPFSERMAPATTSSRAHPRNRYAIRRLQHVKSYESSEFLRSLVYEIASLLPLEWQQFQSFGAGVDASSSDKVTDSEKHPPAAGPEKQLTPHLSQLLRKTLKLFHRSIELASRTTEASTLPAPKQETKQPQAPPDNRSALSSAPDPECLSLRRLAEQGEQALEQVDVNAILSTALIAAVYERVGVVAPIELSSLVQPLGPTAFWSGNASNHQILALHDGSLGDEMYLQQSTHKQ